MELWLRIVFFIALVIGASALQGYVLNSGQPEQAELALKQLDSREDAQNLRESQYWWSGNTATLLTWLGVFFVGLIMFYGDIARGVSKIVSGSQCCQGTQTCPNQNEENVQNG